MVKQIKVQGRVQGVGFRYFTKQKAEQLKLSGWVKNLPDASVLIQVKGNEDEINQFMKWINEGPVLAKVNKITQELIDHLDPRFDDFKIIRD